VLTDGNIKIGRSTVTDKVMALGKVELNDSALLGGTTGSMKICVDQPLPVPAANNLSNRMFHFTVTGAAGIGTAANPAKAATGSCTKIFDVAAGPQTVSELNNGTLITPAEGTFSGNFELFNVTRTTPSSPSTLGSVNLTARTASVNLVAGDAASQMTLVFSNRTAITGFIEICKRRSNGPGTFNPAGPNPLSGGDIDVQGFFKYTISGVYVVSQQYPNIKSLQEFTIPAGQCTGPLSITIGSPAPFDDGGHATLITVSELPRAGTYLESIEVIPPSRRTSADNLGTIIGVDNAGSNILTPAPGGGHVTAKMLERPDAADETLFIFANRSNPGRLKVCKIAGPGIPLNTLFRFTVSGIGATGAFDPQSAGYGPVTRTVDVRAGDPAQGGTCEIVPGFGANAPGFDQFQTFVNGTAITIVENGISPANTIAQETGELRTSMIRVFGSAFTTTAVAGFGSNPDTSPSSGYVSRAVVTARAAIVETDFTGFRFTPAVLKICSVAENPNTLGSQFTYLISLVRPQIGGPNPGPMFPAWSSSLTLLPGPVGSGEGNCQIVNGAALSGGAVNQGSTITVSQGGVLTTLISITCPTCGAGGLSVEQVQQRATLSGPNGIQPGINTIVFRNLVNVICRSAGSGSNKENTLTAARLTVPTCTRTTLFDFDGDRKSDPTVFDSATGGWKVASSIANYAITTRTFGVAGDKAVPADYDADGKTDLAVWRPSDGRWYVQGSAGSFTYLQWGEPDDIPQPGDYDGDGKSDFAVFRPFTGTWYIKTSSGQISVVQFGVSTDKPVAADYDGDGRTDRAVFRNGTWYFQNSMSGFKVTQFGQANDIPVAGDYDGDGVIDLAAYRGGTWYILTATTYTVRNLGLATDIPVPADYDGDGKYDRAVWRPTTGNWYISRSGISESDIPIVLGVPGEIPVQSPHWLLP